VTRFLMVLTVLLTLGRQAHADAVADCSQTQDLDRRISGCSRYIDANVSSRNLEVWNWVTAAIAAREHSYRLKGQHDLAINDFARVIKRRSQTSGNDHSMFLNRAMSYEAIGETRKAIADYELIILDYKRNPDPTWGIGTYAAEAEKALVRLGAASPAAKPKEDDSDFDEDLRRYAPSAEDLGRYFADKAEADFKRGVELRKKGEFDESIALHTAALEDFPEKPEFNSARAEAYLDRGRSHYAKGDYERAISDNTEVLRLKPNETKALNNRGNAYRALGQPDKAIEDLTTAIRIKPTDYVLYYTRGAAYRDIQDYERALEDYNEALRLEPSQALIYLNRGRTFYMWSSYRRAIRDFDNAIKLSPRMWAAYRARGYAYSRLGETALAYEDFAKARDINPSVKIDPPAVDEAAVRPPAADKTTADQMELSFWNDVKDSGDPALLQAYLDQFPNGVFRPLAEYRLQKLR